jgi:drug/metabolite transporter (DMT)-like permease
MKQAMLASDALLGARGSVAGVGLFLSVRFGLAALVLAVAVKSARAIGPREWAGGFVLGGLLFAGFLMQMLAMSGADGVTPAVSAFLTSLYVVFTALLTTALTRRGVGLPLVAGCVLATFGAGWIHGPPHLEFHRPEWLTVACAFVFAVHILATDRVTRSTAPMPVTLASFVWVALGSGVTLAFGLAGDGAPSLAETAALLRTVDFALPLVLSSLFATVLAISLMNLFQRELEPVRAAILYALEPVWAACLAITAGMDAADGWLLVGGGALLAGNIISELGPLLARRRAPT